MALAEEIQTVRREGSGLASECRNASRAREVQPWIPHSNAETNLAACVETTGVFKPVLDHR